MTNINFQTAGTFAFPIATLWRSATALHTRLGVWIQKTGKYLEKFFPLFTTVLSFYFVFREKLTQNFATICFITSAAKSNALKVKRNEINLFWLFCNLSLSKNFIFLKLCFLTTICLGCYKMVTILLPLKENAPIRKMRVKKSKCFDILPQHSDF